MSGRKSAELLERALMIICRGGVISAYVLSSRLGISEQEADIVLGLLLAEGYLAAEKMHSCGSCPLRSMCPYAGKAQPKEIYYLTGKGRRICGRLETHK